MSDDFRYEVIIYWSEQDSAFIAEVPELPGCAADGASHQEAISAIKVIVDQWLETARALGRDIPAPSRPPAVRLRR
jgi:predicted RNase H-like HicB family nuclease